MSRAMAFVKISLVSSRASPLPYIQGAKFILMSDFWGKTFEGNIHGVLSGQPRKLSLGGRKEQRLKAGFQVEGRGCR